MAKQTYLLSIAFQYDAQVVEITESTTAFKVSKRNEDEFTKALQDNGYIFVDVALYENGVWVEVEDTK